MKLLNILIIGIISILLAGLAVAQIGITFPNNFEVTIPQLPPRLSANQILFNCPYDTDIQYRAVGVRGLTWNGTIPMIDIDVKYWTQDKSCAGSKRIRTNLPITLSQQQLMINLQNSVNTIFLTEAQSNHQQNSSSGYIAGSSGLSTGPGAGGSGI